MTWHADTAVLDRYARGQLDDIDAASVEAHVTRCSQCRQTVAAHVNHRALAEIKLGLDERLDAPRPGWVVRWLTVIGVPDHDARLIAGSLSLEASWCAASLVAMCFALLAATAGSSRASLGLFLVVAPLVPLAGVALAFGRRVDPTFEIAQSCPMPTIRILLVRALAIVGLTVPVLVVLSLAFGTVLAFAWLLPAIALAAAALAAGTWVRLTHAAIGLTALWVGIATVSFSGARGQRPRRSPAATSRSIGRASCCVPRWPSSRWRCSPPAVTATRWLDEPTRCDRPAGGQAISRQDRARRRRHRGRAGCHRAARSERRRQDDAAADRGDRAARRQRRPADPRTGSAGSR